VDRSAAAARGKIHRPVSSCLGAPAAASVGESGDRSQQRRMQGVGKRERERERERKASERVPTAEMGGGHE